MKLSEIKTRQTCSREAYKLEVEALRIRLGELERRCREREVPTILAFHGFSASGKGTMVAELLQALDPRQYTVHSIFEESDEEVLAFVAANPGAIAYVAADTPTPSTVKVIQID